MSSFNQTINSNAQFIVGIKVIKAPTMEEYESGIAQKSIMNAPVQRALIDTGASNTCISQNYADDLRLIPVGKSSTMTAGGNCDVNQYKIDFAVPVKKVAGFRTIEKNGKKITEPVIDEEHWAHAQHKVNSFPSADVDMGFEVILGMDILSKMHITMFNGQIILSF